MKFKVGDKVRCILNKRRAVIVEYFVVSAGVSYTLEFTNGLKIIVGENEIEMYKSLTKEDKHDNLSLWDLSAE